MSSQLDPRTTAPRPAHVVPKYPSQIARERGEQAVAEARAAIMAAYPHHGQPIKLKMHWGGFVEIGFESAVAALVAGRAELVLP